jgi:hypothetical protein
MVDTSWGQEAERKEGRRRALLYFAGPSPDAETEAYP